MPGIRKTPAGSWRASYREPAGRQVSKTFKPKREATAFLAQVNTTTSAGAYVSPHAGRALFGDHARQWMVDGAGRIEASAWERRSQGFGYHKQSLYDWTAVALDPTGAARRLESRLPVRQQTSSAKGKSTVERGYYRVAAVSHRAATGPTSRSTSRDSTN